MDFRTESLATLVAAVRRGDTSARDLTAQALAVIGDRDPEIRAFASVDGERAMEEAAAVDARLADGDEVGPLAGIPLAVKDNEDAVGHVTTHGSALHRGDPPASADSLLVERLRAAGCVVVGKTSTSEFAWTFDTENPLRPRARNPWDLRRSAGGSSGGSAAAVASGMVPLATGSDGGGSIRVPAAVCGIAGFKPSTGRVPTSSPPRWLHLNARAPMARTVHDTAYALDCVVGPDPTDLSSLPMPEASWTRSLHDPHLPLRIGWAPTLGYATIDAEVRQVCEAAVRVLAGRGAEIVEIDDLLTEDPFPHVSTIAGTALVRALAPWRASGGWDQLSGGLRRFLEWAERCTVDQLHAALDACHAINLRLVARFHDVGVILTPTVATASPPLEGHATVDGEPAVNWVRCTYPFNLTRSPAGTVNAGFDGEGRPVGLQVVGPQHGDVVVLRAMAALEQVLGEVDRLPPTP